MNETVNQPTNVPIAKMQAVGYSGLVLTVIAIIAGVSGVQIPEDLAMQAVAGAIAITGLINFVVGYFKKSKLKETI